MNSLVLDASFLVKLLVRESGSELAQAIFEAYEAAGAAPFIPNHGQAEIVEVLRRKLAKVMIGREQFDDALTSLPAMAENVDIGPLMEDAARIAVTFAITVYDALYVALAARRKALMLTADRKLVERLRDTPYGPLMLGIDGGQILFHGT
jgi:predicted nucleic acid-binding protein